MAQGPEPRGHTDAGGRGDGGGGLDVKTEQYPPHRRSPGVARCWLWAGLARQASRKRWAQHRDQNRA